MQSKPFYQSKQLWLNTIGLAVVVLDYLGTIHVGNPALVGSVLAVLNMVLRVTNNQSSLTLK